MLIDFQIIFTDTFCGKFVINWLLYLYHHTSTVSLHYLVKYKFSKITIITINTYVKGYPLKRFPTDFLI